MLTTVRIHRSVMLRWQTQVISSIEFRATLMNIAVTFAGNSASIQKMFKRVADCASGATCVQRSGCTTVSGCAGKGALDYDLCHIPYRDALTGASSSAFSLPLDFCADDCDSDEDWARGLTCSQRSGYTAVPGCIGQGLMGKDFALPPFPERIEYIV